MENTALAFATMTTDSVSITLGMYDEDGEVTVVGRVSAFAGMDVDPGTVLEVEFDGLCAEYTLRNPRVVGFSPSTFPEDCDVFQL